MSLAEAIPSILFAEDDAVELVLSAGGRFSEQKQHASEPNVSNHDANLRAQQTATKAVAESRRPNITWTNATGESADGHFHRPDDIRRTSRQDLSWINNNSSSGCSFVKNRPGMHGVEENLSISEGRAL